jgi:hypothetical protein
MLSRVLLLQYPVQENIMRGHANAAVAAVAMPKCIEAPLVVSVMRRMGGSYQ